MDAKQAAKQLRPRAVVRCPDEIHYPGNADYEKGQSCRLCEGGWMTDPAILAGAEALEQFEALTFELAIYRQACASMRPEALADNTHAMMNAAVGNVSALLQPMYSPCDALKEAEQLMQPAWDAWSILVTRLAARSKAGAEFLGGTEEL